MNIEFNETERQVLVEALMRYEYDFRKTIHPSVKGVFRLLRDLDNERADTALALARRISSQNVDDLQRALDKSQS